MHRAVVNHGHIIIAVVFTIVASVMFQTGGHALFLNPSYLCHCQSTVQIGIFGIVLEETTAKRVTQDIAGRSQQDTALHSTQLFAHDVTGALHNLGIPCGTEQDTGRKSGSTGTSVRTTWPVTPTHIGYIQSRDSLETRESARTKRHFFLHCQCRKECFYFLFSILCLYANRYNQ